MHVTQTHEQTLFLHVRLFKSTKLLQLKMTGRNFMVEEAVWVLLLWTVQLLTVLIHVLQHPAAVGRCQLEPHLQQ